MGGGTKSDELKGFSLIIKLLIIEDMFFRDPIMVLREVSLNRYLSPPHIAPNSNIAEFWSTILGGIHKGRPFKIQTF